MSHFLTKAELHAMISMPGHGSLIRLEEMEDKTPRTLIYGYDCDRQTFHLFIGSAQNFVVTWANPNNGRLFDRVDYGGVIDAHTCVPNKRVYPQYCDLEFCLTLRARGVNPPFTTWAEPDFDPTGRYVGML